MRGGEDGRKQVKEGDRELSMNRMTFSFERLSLTPALSRWEHRR